MVEQTYGRKMTKNCFRILKMNRRILNLNCFISFSVSPLTQLMVVLHSVLFYAVYVYTYIHKMKVRVTSYGLFRKFNQASNFQRTTILFILPIIFVNSFALILDEILFHFMRMNGKPRKYRETYFYIKQTKHTYS